MRDPDEMVDSISIQVGRWLKYKGYSLASCSGVAKYVLTKSDSLGLLKENPNAKTKKHLFGLFTETNRKMFVGTIWFNNYYRNANKDNWVFEIFGIEHFKPLLELSKELALTFDVKINVEVEVKPQT